MQIDVEATESRHDRIPHSLRRAAQARQSGKPLTKGLRQWQARCHSVVLACARLNAIKVCGARCFRGQAAYGDGQERALMRTGEKGESLSETTCRLLDRGGCVEKDELDGMQMYW